MTSILSLSVGDKGKLLEWNNLSDISVAIHAPLRPYVGICLTARREYLGLMINPG
jgi:hypothetical protein